MKVWFVVTLGVILFSVSAVFGNVCSGRQNGAQLPNIADCSTYYVCDYGNPKLVQCSAHLLYDHRLGVCNWPENVSCDQVVSTNPSEGDNNNWQQVVPMPQQPIPQIPQIQMPQLPTDNQNNQPDLPYEYIGDNDEPNQYYPGIAIAPNNPFGFQCTIDGFYFAPHPDKCEQYFICENRRIHAHQCASGIHWDYVHLQCDYAEKAYCFTGHSYSPIYGSFTGSLDLTTIGVTAPVAIDQPVITESPQLIEEIQEEKEIEIEQTEYPSVCADGQSFMKHHDDCHRYYICIASLPISISCPDQMAWDDESLQCTEDALAFCDV